MTPSFAGVQPVFLSPQWGNTRLPGDILGELETASGAQYWAPGANCGSKLQGSTPFS